MTVESAEPVRRGISPRHALRLARLWSGLILFAYVSMHLLNHAFGIRSLDGMRAAAPFLLAPWQTLPGLVLLYTALSSHLALGLYALYRRRHLRMPAAELAQLTLGLMVPLLLIAHSAAIRIGHGLDLDIRYPRVVYQYWIYAPDLGLPRQLLLIVVVWIHGCIGIRNWLRPNAWYPAWMPTLTALATLLPVLSILGFVNAGLDMREADAATLAALAIQPHEQQGFATVYRIVDLLILGYLALVSSVFGLRLLRDWHGGRFRAVRLTYPDGRTISVPQGFSVLEASRWAGIPHASVCGGRGRCSTCRVDVIAGGESLPQPGPEEERLLDRIGAPPGVRLACQIRPTSDLSIVPLVHPDHASNASAGPISLQLGRRQEADVAALFVDLRQSTRLADDRLPYDALFIVERFVSTVSAAVRANGGHVTNVAGDGVMSVFSSGGSAAGSARNAFRAALALWEGVEALSLELGAELREPLRFGIGLHVGVAVIGVRWGGGLEGMPFLGDTGNVAARLEAETKRIGCVLIASREAIELVAGTDVERSFPSVMIAGKQEPVEVLAFADSASLRRLLEAKADA